MLMRIIAILSFLGAVAYGLLAKLTPAELWKCALAFALAFLALSALFVLCAAVVSLFIDTSWPRKKQNPLCRFFVRYGGELGCFYCGVRVHVSGTEKLPKDERFLLVANHRSLFDPLSIFHALGAYNIAFISKPSNLRIPVLGRLALGDCFLPIDRENDREALKSILCAADYLKRDLCSICIYPEGTRSKTRQMLPFHHGSFKIAQRAHVPLVIAAVSGTDMVKKNALRRFTDVYIDILELIPAEEVRAQTTAELSDHAYAAIAEALEKREGKA